MTRLDRLRDLAEKLEASFDAKYEHDAQGAAALARLLKSTWLELEELEAKDAATVENIPEPEYTQRLTESAEGWPDRHLEAVVGVYDRRHGTKKLRLIKGEG